MKYAYIDGDDIGLKIENSFMNNNEEKLREINNDVKSMIQEITKYLTQNNFEIIFSGADGIICKSESVCVKDILEYIRGLDHYLKFSIGVGNCLRDSYLALRYAKSNGKNIGAIFDDGFEIIN
ncbi:mCpol domain-containing protein [Paenibacillus xylanexedens]|uniref:mCpol domain-containing protein n=1 Tax=Paenibacillus xylanexedens TaxID=528191 RepID=UPI000F53427F|nr:mCpol domain-containing protein [Paenibacillus xylanexedens]